MSQALSPRDQLLLELLNQLNTVSMAIDALADKAGDPTFDATRADELVLDATAISARIDQIKAGAPIRFPTNAEADALAAACDALALIDLTTASAIAIIQAGEAVVKALPVSNT